MREDRKAREREGRGRREGRLESAVAEGSGKGGGVCNEISGDAGNCQSVAGGVRDLTGSDELGDSRESSGDSTGVTESSRGLQEVREGGAGREVREEGRYSRGRGERRTERGEGGGEGGEGSRRRREGSGGCRNRGE